MKVEVLEIFPKDVLNAKDRKSYQAKGNCHVKLPSLKLHVRNISYRVTLDGKVMVKPPFRVYTEHKRPAFVNTLEFEDGDVWKSIEKSVVERVCLLGIKKGPEQLVFPWGNA